MLNVLIKLMQINFEWYWQWFFFFSQYLPVFSQARVPYVPLLRQSHRICILYASPTSLFNNMPFCYQPKSPYNTSTTLNSSIRIYILISLFQKLPKNTIHFKCSEKTPFLVNTKLQFNTGSLWLASYQNKYHLHHGSLQFKCTPREISLAIIPCRFVVCFRLLESFPCHAGNIRVVGNGQVKMLRNL